LQIPEKKSSKAILCFRFFVIVMLAARTAVFFERDFFGHGLSIFRTGVILSLTIRTFERNDVSHIFSYNFFARFGATTGAHDRDRTGDLILTKDVLYQLSYVGSLHPLFRASYVGLSSSSSGPPCGQLSLWYSPALLAKKTVANSNSQSFLCKPRKAHANNWRGVDSNHRRLAPTDLQSAPFGHFGTSPKHVTSKQ
jgi:hypothetical protein